MITNYRLYGPGKRCSTYDEYFKEYFLDILEYSWVRENYNISLDKLRELADSSDKESREYIRLDPVLSKIKTSDIKSLFDLFEEINTEEKAGKFSSKYKLKSDDLDKFLYQAQHYILPKKVQLRQYIFTDDPGEVGYFEILKKNKLANSLALVEACRTKKGRKEISQKTRVPEKILLDFINRISVGRLPFFGGKSVKHVWNAGYRSLNDVRNDTPENMTRRLVSAFESVGLIMPNDLKKGCRDGDMIRMWNEMPEIIES